jgi:hypothetical protein
MKEKRVARKQPPVGAGRSLRAASGEVGASTLAPPPLSERERAGRLFAEEVGRLPGVLRVERWGDDLPGAPTFHVYLRADDSETEYAVYELKGQVYDRCPEAYLEVVVLEASDAALTNGERGA